MRWIDPPTVFEEPLPGLSLPLLLRRILVRRGYATPEAVDQFLDPRRQPPVEALSLPDAAPAIARIRRALQRKERIGVWGDFDVDGQTATTILVQVLRALGGDVRYYIPIRASEGHGLHLPRLEQFLAQGIRLLITCDTGVTAHAAVEWAVQHGVEVIITDHHDLAETLPPALAVVNPKRLPADHPLAHLSGAGVAYLLMQGLLQAEDQAAAPPVLDLAALGLIADLATLQGETRRLVKEGLEALRQTTRLGLQFLYQQANLNPANLNEEHIGFLIAPRLNALGRLGDANPAVELLTTQNAERARLIARQLESLNLQRQWLTAQVTQAAEARLQEHPQWLELAALVIEGTSWPGGVLGLVASRLVERYGRPTILLTLGEDGLFHGSARSVEGLHITQALARCADLLHGYGGHPMAAGLALPPQNLEAFRLHLHQALREQAPIPPEPTITLDAWVRLDEVNLELAEMLELLAPYGPGNPRPILAARRVEVVNAVAIGRNQEHLRLTVRDERGVTHSVLWWNGNNSEQPRGWIDLAFTVRANDFRGQRSAQLEWVDFHPLPQAAAEVQLLPPEVIDWRARRLDELPPEVPLLAEGRQRPPVPLFFNRYTLPAAEAIALYTLPPGAREWRALYERTRPKRAYWLRDPDPPLTAEQFLTHLAGLVKYALHHKGGQTDVPSLAAATAERELTVRLGLEWLAAGGHIQVEFEDDVIYLSAGNGQANPYAQSDLFRAVRTLLQDSAAYRALWQARG